MDKIAPVQGIHADKIAIGTLTGLLPIRIKIVVAKIIFEISELEMENTCGGTHTRSDNCKKLAYNSCCSNHVPKWKTRINNTK